MSLHLARLRIDARRLDQFARRRRIGHDHELGYVLHAALMELFGEQAPAPFVRDDLLRPPDQRSRGDTLTVLGYTRASATDLRGHADAFADPAVHALVDWHSGFDTKPMPATWAAGRTLGFTTRCCPIKRRRGERKGEVDAFLAAADHAPEDSLDRQAVYRDWLKAHIEPKGVDLLDAELDSFQLVRLVRRRQGANRTGTSSQRPAAVLSGHLTVRDPDAFARFLARGVGRHRAFGFGLLLLRPPRR